MGVESQQISKRLDANGRSRHRISLWNRSPEKHSQGFPSTTTQFPKEPTIVEEITSKDLGDAEDKTTMGLPANLDSGHHSTAGRKAEDRSFRRQIPRLPEAGPLLAALWISEKGDARGRRSTALNKCGPPVGIGDRYDLKALKRFPFHEPATSRLADKLHAVPVPFSNLCTPGVNQHEHSGHVHPLIWRIVQVQVELLLGDGELGLGVEDDHVRLPAPEMKSSFPAL